VLLAEELVTLGGDDTPLQEQRGATPRINARGRIGPGPRYNIKHQLIASNVADLHGDQQRDRNNVRRETMLDIKGEPRIMFPCGISMSNPVTGTYPQAGRQALQTAVPAACVQVVAAAAYSASRSSKANSLCCEVSANFAEFIAAVFRSCRISQFDSHMASHAVGLCDETQPEKADIYFSDATTAVRLSEDYIRVFTSYSIS